jgi:hypothetical protein
VPPPAWERAHCWHRATAGGAGEARWPREDVPPDTGPGARVPSIQRCGGVRGPRLSPAPRPSTRHGAVSLSADLGAFPRALAFATSPRPLGLRWIPAPPRSEPGGRDAVPGCGVPWRGGPHGAPGDFREAFWSTGRRVQPFSRPVVGHAPHPRRLVPPHDDAAGRACTSPCAPGLGGVRWGAPRDRRARPLPRLEGQSPPWGLGLTLASGGEAWPRCRPQVITDLAVSTLHP